MLAVAAMANTARGAMSGDVQPRLARAAEQFEAQMMKELLKPMANGSSLTSEQNDDADSGGALGEFACEALGQALSAQGGLGIAHRIEQELSRSGTVPVRTQRTANLPLPNRLSGHE
jgi:Rod binding domain-containing protein